MKRRKNLSYGKKGLGTISDIQWYLAFAIVGLLFGGLAVLTHSSAIDKISEEYQPSDGVIGAVNLMRWPAVDAFPELKDNIENGQICFEYVHKDVSIKSCPLDKDAKVSEFLAFYFYAKENELDVPIDSMREMIPSGLARAVVGERGSEIENSESSIDTLDYGRMWCMIIEHDGEEIKPEGRTIIYENDLIMGTTRVVSHHIPAIDGSLIEIKSYECLPSTEGPWSKIIGSFFNILDF